MTKIKITRIPDSYNVFPSMVWNVFDGLIFNTTTPQPLISVGLRARNPASESDSNAFPVSFPEILRAIEHSNHPEKYEVIKWFKNVSPWANQMSEPEGSAKSPIFLFHKSCCESV